MGTALTKVPRKQTPNPPTFDNHNCHLPLTNPRCHQMPPEGGRIPVEETWSPHKTDKIHDRTLEREKVGEALGLNSGQEEQREHPRLWGEHRRPGGVPCGWASIRLHARAW